MRQRLSETPETDLFLSVITIGEIVNGVARLAQGKRRRELEAWLTQIEQIYGSRILPVDVETGRIWGEVTAKAGKNGRVIPVADGLIAATALRHGLHVMTRNSADFQATGVLLIDPWES
ncbi:MAG: type II toxin-antitoxin system VapC family toxin [Planctomycetota bacterium]|nr:type II toxin-antitoxin system VapC family toxin [Planctomycetota bacterium]